jgi:hypothetical protein
VTFSPTSNNQITLWLSNPTCQDAHNALLGRLVEIRSKFIGANDEPSQIVRGNLGEFIAMRVAEAVISSSQTFAPNAINPLNSASISGLDLTYLFFHQTDENLDLAFIQEVKTTAQSSLGYADNLIVDYGKLFGTNINFTLESRLQAISSSLEIERKLPALVPRVLKLGATSPQACSKIRLVPTMVHERNGTQPFTKMVAIRQAIASKGWHPSTIEAWAIALTDLDDRLTRLARGHT